MSLLRERIASMVDNEMSGYGTYGHALEIADAILSLREIAGLATALPRYGHHLPQCRWRGGFDCDCGFEEAKALAAAARQGGDVKQAPAESPQSGHEVATPRKEGL